MRKNKLLVPLICVIMSAIMYCFAFHEQRDKNKILEDKITKLEKKLKQ